MADMNTHNNGSTPLSNSSAPTVPPNMTRVRLLLQQQQRHPQQQPSPQQQLLLQQQQQQQQQQQYLDQLRRGILLGGVDKIMSIFTRMRSEMEEMVLKERKSKEDILAILQRQRDDLTKLASEREELEKILNRQNSELQRVKRERNELEERLRREREENDHLSTEIANLKGVKEEAKEVILTYTGSN